MREAAPPPPDDGEVRQREPVHAGNIDVGHLPAGCLVNVGVAAGDEHGATLEVADAVRTDGGARV